MADGYILTEADRDNLRRLRSMVEGTGIHHWPQDSLPGAPEVYVARVPDTEGGEPGELPGLTPKGEEESYDHPGSALCDIYQISVYEGGSDLIPISGFSRPVFNLGRAIRGQWLLVVRDKAGRWIASNSSNDVIPFQLKTSLTPGGTADAYPTTPDGTIIDEELTIEVTDTIGDKRAIGKDDRSAGGALGLAEVLADGTVAIVEIHQQAKRCKCQIDDAGGIEATDASINVDNVTPTDGGQSPVASSSTDLTVYIQLNPSSSGGFTGADNTVCYIEWHEDDDKYYIYEMPCAAS